VPKAAVTQTAQAVLDARAKYPESTLADLYDPLTMPPELSKAHAKLDTLVDKPIDAPLVNLGACSGQALRPALCHRRRPRRASLRALRGHREECVSVWVSLSQT
jgi:hypothetical protein